MTRSTASIFEPQRRGGAAALRLALLLAAAIAPAETSAQSRPDLFDVLQRAEFRAAYARLVEGERDLPAWMATPEAATEAAGVPGTLADVGGQRWVRFHICEPHACSQHDFVIMFFGFGEKTARGLLMTEGMPRFLGNPDEAERDAMMRGLRR